MKRSRLFLLNTTIVLFFTLINVLLGLFEIKLFISKYGSDTNGLIQTGNQIMMYVTLFEGSICASFLFSMYKPMANKDYKKLSSLHLGFKRSILKTVVLMLIAAIALSFVFPFAIKTNELNYSFMVTVFLLVSIKTILPYFISIVPKYMIILKERRYLAELITGATKAFILAAEIALLFLTNIPLIWLLVICVILTLLFSLSFKAVALKMYGKKLKESDVPDYSPNRITKEAAVHSFSSLVFNSTDNIVLSTLNSLNSVTIYSNYNMVSNQTVQIFTSIADGAAPSFGIKLASDDKNTYDRFRLFNSLFLFASSIVATVFITMINDFISLWVGNDFCSSNLNVVLFGIILFTGCSLPSITIFRDAKGLFKESKAFTIAQSILNIIITLTLVPFIGISGALIGTVAARIIITVPFNFVLVKKRVFENKYIGLYEFFLLLVFTLILSSYLQGAINTDFLLNYFQNGIIVFIVKALISTVISSLFFFITVAALYKEFRMCIFRFLRKCTIKKC